VCVSQQHHLIYHVSQRQTSTQRAGHYTMRLYLIMYILQQRTSRNDTVIV